MCLAIPARVVEIVDAELQIAKAEVGGVRRNINLALIDEPDDPVRPGDWVLIHVGFAMSRIDEAEAERTLQALDEIGAAYRQELKELQESRIE
jgi:hydrogenase expression/formation protein HypC